MDPNSREAPIVTAALSRLRGRGYLEPVRRRLFNPHDLLWDLRLGVQTFGWHPSSGEHSDDVRFHYEPTPYSDIFRLLRMVDLGSGDVFTDFGAGLGRAVFAASWMGAKRATGVEIVPELCAKAARSHRQGRLARRDIEFACARAQDYRPAAVTVVFLFNPFGEPTLRHVIRNIEKDRDPHRDLRIIYVNPMFDSVLHQTSWLRCIAHVPPSVARLSPSIRFPSTLWRST